MVSTPQQMIVESTVKCGLILNENVSFGKDL